MIDHDIDFTRAIELMDTVQKQASVAPQCMAIGSLAMMELKEMNEEAQESLNELGRQRLKAEQDAAAELNAKAQADAEEQARIDAERAATPPQIPSIMPGEPVPQKVQIAAGDIQPPTEDHNADGIADQQEGKTPVTRRV